MSYIERNLISGETVAYRTRLHWIVMGRRLLLGGIMAAAGIALLVFTGPTRPVSAAGGTSASPEHPLALLYIAVALIVLSLIVGASAYWKRSATEMVVTNKRVLAKVGVLTHRSTEIMLAKVESVIVDQGLLGRILGYGTVVVRGTGGTPEPFQRIANPVELRRQVQQQIDRLTSSPIS